MIVWTSRSESSLKLTVVPVLTFRFSGKNRSQATGPAPSCPASTVFAPTWTFASRLASASAPAACRRVSGRTCAGVGTGLPAGTTLTVPFMPECTRQLNVNVPAFVNVTTNGLGGPVGAGRPLFSSPLPE